LLQSYKQVVQVNESEALSASNLGLCQIIIDDANCSLSTSIDGPWRGWNESQQSIVCSGLASW